MEESKSNESSAGNWETVPLSSEQPSARLPALKTIDQLPSRQRHAALAAWIAWFNGHRQEVGPELERQLDHVLTCLDRNEVCPSNLDELQGQFDQWLNGVLDPETEHH